MYPKTIRFNLKIKATDLTEKLVKRRYSLTLTKTYVRALNQLVEKGIYLTHQVAIRDALRRHFRYHKIEPFYSDFVEEVKKIDN